MAAQSCARCPSVPNQFTTSQGLSYAPGVGRLKVCTGCRIVRYCSKECQKQDWPQHKELCKYIQKKIPAMPDATSLRTRVTPGEPLQAGPALKKEAVGSTPDVVSDDRERARIEFYRKKKADLMSSNESSKKAYRISRIQCGAIKPSQFNLEWGKDKETTIACLGKDPDFLRYASPTLQNDREVVLTAIRETGYTLKYASPTLKNDREVVLTAIRGAGCALKYASPDLQRNKEIALTAVRQSKHAVYFVHPDLLTEKEIALACVDVDKVTGETVFNYPTLVRTEKEYEDAARAIRKAIQDDMAESVERLVSELPEWNSADPKIVLAYVKKNGLALEFADEDLTRNKEIALAAIGQNKKAVDFVHPDLYKEKEIEEAFIAINGMDPDTWKKREVEYAARG